MQPTPYIWKNGSMVPWQDATVHVLSHCLHYGTGAWEGIRCYKTDRGPAVFRLREHIERLLHSASVIALDVPYSQSEIEHACIDTLKKNMLEESYIRPLFFYGYGKLGINPIGNPPECIIACFPWAKYFKNESLKVAFSKYRRLTGDAAVMTAKLAGQYGNAVLVAIEGHQRKDVDEMLLCAHDGNIAEGHAANFFMVKNGIVKTPQKGSILPGITRDTVMTLARDRGYDVQESVITRSDVLAADECFFTGTAAEVAPITEIEGQVIGTGVIGRVTKELQTDYADAVRGRNAKNRHWLTLIS